MSSEDLQAALPLAGCRVLEHSRSVAAAYAGRLLAALGATVVMLEPPGGSPLRSAPPLLSPAAGSRRPSSALFAYLAAGKGSLVCDLLTPAGRESLAGELHKTDILIDDTPVRDRDVRNLEPAAVASRFPNLVHVSILPFGANGPKSDWEGEEVNLLHAGGEGFLLPNGLSHELFPDRPPLKIYGHFSQYQGGVMAVVAALSAWWAAPRAGGQYVDVSVQDAALSVGAFALQRLGDGSVEHRSTRRFRYGGVFEAQGGFLELLTLEERQWTALVELLGNPGWAQDEKLRDPLERSRRGDEINLHIREWMRQHNVDEIVEQAQKLGVPAAKYRAPVEVIHGEHERARGLFAPLRLEDGTLAEVLMAPFQFRCSPLRSGGRVPALGESGPAVVASAPTPPRIELTNTSRAVSPDAPLRGVRIADFTIHAAGPFGTQLLAQLGAECIKIESKTRLDAFRKPHAVYGRMTAATFDQVSVNKLSVRLNLKQPEAVQLAKRLVSISDVTAESFRAGVMQRLGLGFEQLRAVKSDLILLSLSSCGQSGPDSHFAGYAPLFGAWGGLGWLTGYADGPPVEMRHVMDHSAGAHAAAATIAALVQRRDTGKAQHIDLAAREVASAMIGDALLQASLGITPVRTGNRHLSFAPHGVYPTQQPDRWLTLAVRNDSEWQTLAGVLGHREAASDPRFATAAGRLRWGDELDLLVTRWLADCNADATAERLQAAGVCAHVSWNTQDIACDAHLRTRGATIQVSGPDIPPRQAVGAPARFSRTSAVGISRLTPALGQDEEYVFGELLGLSSAQRAELQRREVIL
jgi:crotonobetainyl-CoA:carnitine CoA-transferase CaiB-like acyl-CoA transferase